VTHQWKIEFTNNQHNNHEPSRNLAEIPAARKLTPEQHDLVINLANAGIPPRFILRTLKASDPNNLSTSQDIYNVIKKQRLADLNGRTPLEALIDNLKANDVFHTYELDSDQRLLRFFVAPKASVKSALDFWTSDVLLMDSTYKTNR
jgi:hypothetical protein